MKIFLAALAWFAFAAPEVLVNGTAGRVGKSVFTVDDVRFFDAVVKLREGITKAPELEGATLRSAAQKLVFEEMVTAEMRSLHVEQSARRQAEDKLKNIRSKISEADWKSLLSRHQKGEPAVVAALQRNIEVEKFLEKKVETLTTVVTDAEAERYFTANQAKFAGTTFDVVRPTVIHALQKQEMEKGLSEWVRLLKDKHHAMNLLEN